MASIATTTTYETTTGSWSGYVMLAALLLIVIKLIRRFAPQLRWRPRAGLASQTGHPAPKPAKARRSAAQTPPQVPCFDVVALGPRGSGKTLLLTSMYHQLQTTSGAAYHLTAPFDQVVLLNQWFGEVADPEQDWPSGTAIASTREFTFTLQTRTTSGRSLPVFDLRYLEYAGGLLTDTQAPGSTAQADLLVRIESAHALIGIIDGFWIRRWMDGDPKAKVRLQQTITTMISLMLRAECPITFVITKWDLLSDIPGDDEARLAFVRRALMHNQGFHDLAMEHASRRIVRLVPVSAVGPDFVELGTDGVVSKRPAGELHPTNVDVPLAAVVPDLWEQVEHRVGEGDLRAALAKVHGASGGGLLSAVLELGATVARTATQVVGMMAPQAALMGEFAAALSGEPDIDAKVKRSLQEERLISAAELELEENRAARRRVLRELHGRVDVLEGRMPSSRLSAEV